LECCYPTSRTTGLSQPVFNRLGLKQPYLYSLKVATGSPHETKKEVDSRN
jgi:hypothetical protein